MAYGLGVLVKRASGLKPAARLFIQRVRPPSILPAAACSATWHTSSPRLLLCCVPFIQTVPFTAVASAGACNALAMRYREAL